MIVVDTGYGTDEAARRDRPILRDPTKALEDIGIAAETDGRRCDITHLHYDHTGALHRFSMVRFSAQEAEMAYATGVCICHDLLRMPYTLSMFAKWSGEFIRARLFFTMPKGVWHLASQYTVSAGTLAGSGLYASKPLRGGSSWRQTQRITTRTS